MDIRTGAERRRISRTCDNFGAGGHAPAGFHGVTDRMGGAMLLKRAAVGFGANLRRRPDHHRLQMASSSSTSSTSSGRFRGVFLPLTTPFSGHDQSICFDSLRNNLSKYERIPFAGYVVAGSNGEAPYLSPDERVQLVKFVRSNTNSGKIVIGGSTCESTKSTCELSAAMRAAGADALLIMPPFYFRRRMTEEAIIGHYTSVADDCQLPIIVYNMPTTTGIDIAASTLAKMAKHPNIRGVKDSDVRKCAGVVIDTKDANFDVLIGSAGYLLPALMNGCSGGINGLAGVLGREICDMYTLYTRGRYSEAARIQINLSKPDTLLLAELGVGGLKAAMDMTGLYGGPCRRPILPTTDLDRQKIQISLRQSGFMK